MPPPSRTCPHCGKKNTLSMTELRSPEYKAWAATGDTAAEYWRLGGACKRKKHECAARAKERRERQEAAARPARAAPRPDVGAARGGPGRAPRGSPRAHPAAQAAPPPASPHQAGPACFFNEHLNQRNDDVGSTMSTVCRGPKNANKRPNRERPNPDHRTLLRSLSSPANGWHWGVYAVVRSRSTASVKLVLMNT